MTFEQKKFVAQSDWTTSKMIQVCSKGSLLVTKRGYMVMTSKPKLNYLNGSEKLNIEEHT